MQLNYKNIRIFLFVFTYLTDFFHSSSSLAALEGIRAVCAVAARPNPSDLAVGSWLFLRPTSTSCTLSENIS